MMKQNFHRPFFFITFGRLTNGEGIKSFSSSKCCAKMLERTLDSFRAEAGYF